MCVVSLNTDSAVFAVWLRGAVKNIEEKVGLCPVAWRGALILYFLGEISQPY